LKRRPHEVVLQLSDAGYITDFVSYSESEGETLMGIARLEIIDKLKADPRFANGVFYGLHRSIGNDLIDFRSHTGELGIGSLQIVIDKKTGAAYADIDHFSPYADVVGFVGHSGEVVKHFWKRVFA
jgi:hypothetical protein